MNSIKESKKYKLFKFYNNNRNINKTHVKYLKNSIAEHGQFASICVRKVGKYYFISDGQHRFMACVELDIPVKYIEDDIYTQDSVLHMNTKQSNWRTEDYVHRYAMEGDTTYISLEQMYAFYNFTTSKINDAFCAKNVTNTSKIIKNRTYQININQGKKVLNLATDLFKHTKDGIFLHTKMIRVIRDVIRNNPKRFVDKICLERIPKKKLRIYNNETDIYREFVDAYNYRTQKNKIY
jgi:Glu-tRNA(Gln) amidotransferase subunit E-like FAD-binding protein